MRLISLTICRNSAWCLRASITAALRWCDAAVILDHASIDETPEIIEGLQESHPGRVYRLRVDDPTWREMSHRQMTLEKAREVGATHCAIIDDDEILTENLVPTIRDTIEGAAPGEVLQPPWLILWRSLDKYRDDDSIWSRCQVSMAFRDAPQLCWQTRDFGYDHHRRHPMNSECRTPWTAKSLGGLMHLQHVSWRRLLAKQAWYQCVEMVRWPQFGADEIRKRYSATVNEDGAEFTAVSAEWWGPEKAMLDVGAEPWQEAEIRRMLAEHGREKFNGIDLFGVG